jgi:hypothetical protein
VVFVVGPMRLLAFPPPRDPGAKVTAPERSGLIPDMFSPQSSLGLHRTPRDYLPRGWARRVIGKGPSAPTLPGANLQTEPTGPARRLTPDRAGGFKKRLNWLGVGGEGRRSSAKKTAE